MIGIIGGSGIYNLSNITVLDSFEITTPFGAPSDLISKIKIQDQEMLFLPRHGSNHSFTPSKVNYRANICAMKMLGAKGIFSFSHLPLEIMSFVSYFVFLLSCIAIIIYTTLYFVNDKVPEGITTLIVLVLFLGSMQLLSLSILSEYITKILDETKKRPLSIIKKIINNKND